MGMRSTTLCQLLSTSCLSSEAVHHAVNNWPSNKNLFEAAGTANRASENPPATPNSSLSFSSSEAGAEEDSSSKNRRDLQPKGCEDGDVMKSTKLSKVKKKGEKKQREPRVAFMTKNEVDNLEDGYRWKKLLQMHEPEMQCEEAHREIVSRSIDSDHHVRGPTQPPAPPLRSAMPPLPFPRLPQSFLFPTTSPQNHPNSSYYTHANISPDQLEQPQALPDQSSRFPNIVSSFLHEHI
ncbi:UNVERIFIED_CONTAM: WRKY transcription factor 28 [Sesamum calycinum]|uniref:WRKY transcription factor 28 n=1 Tax=Sesamum calycinum TaxID=2727403 RepID=A0AAW2MAE6_9LAMI